MAKQNIHCIIIGYKLQLAKYTVLDTTVVPLPNFSSGLFPTIIITEDDFG